VWRPTIESAGGDFRGAGESGLLNWRENETGFQQQDFCDLRYQNSRKLKGREKEGGNDRFLKILLEGGKKKEKKPTPLLPLSTLGEIRIKKV